MAEQIFERIENTLPPDEPLREELLHEYRYALFTEFEAPQSAWERFVTGRHLKNHPHFDDIKAKIFANDNYLKEPFECAEGSEVCGNEKCRSSRTVSWARQIRAGDEGATVFIQCKQCGSRSTRSS